MFNRFATGVLSWLQGVINKMLGSSTLQQALNRDLGLTVDLNPFMFAHLQKVTNVYFNQAEWLNKNVVSLNLAASIASEIARAVTIEMDVEITGSPRADYLDAQIERFLPKMREQVEYGCAFGGLMLKPYVDIQSKVCVDFIRADMFYPISFDNDGGIIACIFADQRKHDQYFYTRLELHRMEGSNCIIKNVAYRSSSFQTLGNPVPLTSVMEWENIQEEAVIQNILRPLFAYFKFPLANSVDLTNTSALGISCYTRALDLIKQADEQWSRILWEFKSGERRLFVDDSAFSVDANGKHVLPIEPLYRTLQQVNTPSIDSTGFFKEWSPKMREANYLAGLDAILKKIEFTCSLAYGTISNPNVEARTATEIIITKQRTAALVRDTQKALEETLETLLYAIDTWATLYNLAPAGEYDAVYYWDDSIVADHDTQFTQDTIALDKGVMSKVEWRMRTYGETEELATEKIAMIQAVAIPLPSMINTQPLVA